MHLWEIINKDITSFYSNRVFSLYSLAYYLAIYILTQMILVKAKFEIHVWQMSTKHFYLQVNKF